jgi:hypothetical protein
MKIFLGFLIGLAIAIAIAAVAVKAAFGDISNVGERDKSKDETRAVEVADFDRIEAAGVFEVDVTVGGDYALTLSGKPEALEKTTAEVVDGELVLDNAKPKGDRKSWRGDGVSVVISMPALSSFDAAGVVDADIKGLAADGLNIDLSGVGDVELSGTCNALDADVSGVGKIDAEKLQCRTVKVDVSGVGSASVFASESVDAEIAGIGSIDIYGSPASVSKEKSSPLGSITVK